MAGRGPIAEGFGPIGSRSLGARDAMLVDLTMAIAYVQLWRQLAGRWSPPRQKIRPEKRPSHRRLLYREHQLSLSLSPVLTNLIKFSSLIRYLQYTYEYLRLMEGLTSTTSNLKRQ